jgi:outer membrane protein OmpA-like peptidoglycan-associated protein
LAALEEQQRQDFAIIASSGRQYAHSVIAGLSLQLVTEQGLVSVPCDATLVSSFANGVPLLVRFLVAGGQLPKVKRKDIIALRIVASAAVGAQLSVSAGGVDAKYDVNVVVDSLVAGYRTQHLRHDLANVPALGDDLTPGDAVEVATPLDNEELRNLRKEEERKARRLLRHLNDNLEFYHRIIWSTMSPDRRFMLLDGFYAPGAGGRSIASIVENRVVGIVGNCLVMPVAPGIHLDPAFLKGQATLFERYAPNVPVAPMRLSLPTQGVFAEAVPGSCNACEKKDETRFWRFEESPCGDEPTAIQPLSTDTRRADPGSLVAKDLPSPVVNIQNAPAAPDPTGLAAALGVIGKPDLFRDITGLDQNQKNALASYTQSLEAAKHFGSEAAKLAQTGMQQNNGGLDKSIAGIQKAKDQGLISDQQATDLTMGALRHMVGQGGAADSKLLDSPEVKGLLNSATSSDNARVSLSRPEEAVDVQKGEVSSTSTTPRTVAGYSQYLTPEQAAAVRSRLANARADIPLSAGVDLSGNDETGNMLLYDFEIDQDDIVDGRSVVSSEASPSVRRIDALNVIAEILRYPGAKAYVIGRASQTGSEAHNLPLSEERARAVTNWLLNANVPPAAIKDTFGIGTLEPIIDNRGFENRLNRSVQVLYSVPMTDPPKPVPPEANPQGSTKWAIHFDLSLSGGELLQAGIFLVTLADLSDPNNVKVKQGYWRGFGAGLGLTLGGAIEELAKVVDKLPSADIEKATHFETATPLEFEDFHNSEGVMMAIGGGVGFVGWSSARFSFKKIVTDPLPLDIGGWNMPGPLGFNGGVLSGKLIFHW